VFSAKSETGTVVVFVIANIKYNQTRIYVKYIQLLASQRADAYRLFKMLNTSVNVTFKEV
jgi:hypothetical protein